MERACESQASDFSLNNKLDNARVQDESTTHHVKRRQVLVTMKMLVRVCMCTSYLYYCTLPVIVRVPGIVSIPSIVRSLDASQRVESTRASLSTAVYMVRYISSERHRKKEDAYLLRTPRRFCYSTANAAWYSTASTILLYLLQPVPCT